jgi:hypothetical protein
LLLEALSRLKRDPGGGAKIGQGPAKGLTDRAASERARFAERWEEIEGCSGQA